MELGYTFWQERAHLSGKINGSIEPFKRSIEPFLSAQSRCLRA